MYWHAEILVTMSVSVFKIDNILYLLYKVNKYEYEILY
jgi:hypothetical protein